MSFSFYDTGDFSGIQPAPFKVFVQTAALTLGELNFSRVTGVRLGSLSGIAGLTLLTGGVEDTVELEIAAFDIRAIVVPEPNTLGLFVLGLTGLFWAARRRAA